MSREGKASGARRPSYGDRRCRHRDLAARPLLGSFDQAFQYIQEFTGFFTPGIMVIFLLGLFWKRATEAGAIAAAVTSVVLSTMFKYTLPSGAFRRRQ